MPIWQGKQINVWVPGQHFQQELSKQTETMTRILKEPVKRPLSLETETTVKF